MSDDLLYRKVGRRYVPWGRVYDDGAWPLGAHLVIVQPALQTTRYGIEPDRAAVLAALGEQREAIRQAVAEALKERPQPDDETHRRAFEAYRKAGGLPGAVWYLSTATDVLRALEDALERVGR